MTTSNDRPGGLPERLQIDQICDRFESAWRRGSQPALEAYLKGDPDYRSELLRELLLIDRAYRIQMGEVPTAAEYQARLPEDAAVIAEWFAIQTASPSSTSFPTDDTLPSAIGRYQVLERLGSGGFGNVYLGFDQELKRRVAIKVPRHDRIEDPLDAEHFLSEAQILASLDHPNIVSVYDAGRTRSGVFFVVSKWIEGTDLAKALKRQRLTYGQTAEVAAKVADALQHAHSRKLIHRDLKPANILLDSEGEPYLADFGLALSDEAFGRNAVQGGTPHYMSPEQARGEGHLVDGRSDIFSLGIVLYELLTGERPFRGESNEEVLDRIRSVEPRPPRQLCPDVPKELERICLKATAKRAADRYTAAVDMADDLRHYLSRTLTEPVSEPLSTARLVSIPEVPLVAGKVRIVPKGLRSFDQFDADFFLELLPGARDRDGLPEIIRHWKTRIEQADSDRAFRIGLVYGPSGSGKSSMIKAGLIPRLAKSVTPVYVEMSGIGDEQRLLANLQKRFGNLPSSDSLVDVVSGLRRGRGLPPGQKVLIVLDQFEQWLHRNNEPKDTQLVNALRQCDGQHLQCLILARDDFWMATTRFMHEAAEPIVEGHNSAAVDMFDPLHARKVLAEFGRAFGRLPEDLAQLPPEQGRFLDLAVAELTQNGKIVPVRLALFADIVRRKEWVPATLRNVGGERGITMTFLEETFSAATAPPEHRLHQRASRAVLASLLPADLADIRGSMRSHGELLRISGYEADPDQFLDLMRILDTETRLLTPVDPDAALDGGLSPDLASDQMYYHLTHDHLVQPLREWLTIKQRESYRGRARLLLSERSARWNAIRENRQLPSWWEFLHIRGWTRKREWTDQEKQMMAVAGRRFTQGCAAAAALLAVTLLIAYDWRGRVTANALSLNPHIDIPNWTADQTQVATAFYRQHHRWLKPRLEGILKDEASTDVQRRNANLVLFWSEGPDRSPAHRRRHLYRQMLLADAPLFHVLSAALEPAGQKLVDEAFNTAERAKASPGPDRNSQAFRALCFLARLLQSNPELESQWLRHSELMADQLVAEVTSEPSSFDAWIEVLGRSKDQLVPALRSIAQDPENPPGERLAATNLLVSCSTGPQSITPELLGSASSEQFASLLRLLLQHQPESIEWLREIHEYSVEESSDQERLLRAKANATVALAALGEWRDVWPRLARSPDPRLRTYLIHHLANFGTPPNEIVRQFTALGDRRANPDLCEALLLSLGEYPLAQLSSSDRRRVVDQLVKTYQSDPDTGVHSAAEWLLGKWGLDDTASKVIAPFATGNPVENRHWYVTKSEPHFTMMILRPEGPVRIGTPPGPDTASYESEVTIEIPRVFAVASKEVTIEQYKKYYSIDAIDRNYAASDLCPVTYVTWRDAARYCNRISEEEALTGDQLCYLEKPDGEIELAPDYLHRTGYRLLTEAEWEFACRAGTVTVRSDGNALELLHHYQWYNASLYRGGKPVSKPVGLLKPNSYGLFDMLGNVAEWCMDRADANSRSKLRQNPIDTEDSVRTIHDVGAENERSMRGGKFSDVPYALQSARRQVNSPNGDAYNVGFRIGRTMPGKP